MTSSSERKPSLQDLPDSAQARWARILGGPAATKDADDGAALLAQALDGIYGAVDARTGPRAQVLERLRHVESLQGVLPDEACAIAREDALGRTGLDALLGHPARLRPEHLAQLEPTAPLIARLLRIADELPDTTRAALRAKVEILAARLSAHLEHPLREATSGGPKGRGSGHRLPGAKLDLPRTLRHNLRHYDLANRKLGIERLYFRPSRPAASTLRVIIALDSSGSMDDARLHGILMASVLTRLPHLEPRLLLFDTRVMDVSTRLEDPVGLLLGTRLGGGTDLGAAVSHAVWLVEDPARTLFVLISDFEPGCARERFLDGLRALSERGVGLLCLRAPDQAGQDDRETWVPELASLGIAVQACAPEELAGPLAAVLATRRENS